MNLKGKKVSPLGQTSLFCHYETLSFMFSFNITQCTFTFLPGHFSEKDTLIFLAILSTNHITYLRKYSEHFITDSRELVNMDEISIFYPYCGKISSKGKEILES